MIQSFVVKIFPVALASKELSATCSLSIIRSFPAFNKTLPVEFKEEYTFKFLTALKEPFLKTTSFSISMSLPANSEISSVDLSLPDTLKLFPA